MRFNTKDMPNQMSNEEKIVVENFGKTIQGAKVFYVAMFIDKDNNYNMHLNETELMGTN